MKKQNIISEIIQKVGFTDFDGWQIGLAQDTTKRKAQWKEEGRDVSSWTEWAADSVEEAREIESYFINEKKMKGGTPGEFSPYRVLYVYIF